MTVFGIDSAGASAGVAVLQDGVLAYDCVLQAGRTHSETLLRMCENVFTALGLAPSDVDLFAAAAGPGSFTGLRIGLSLVKGLAFPNDTPCAAVSTLAAIAASVPAEGTLLTALDARRGEVYWAAFHSQGGTLTRLTPDEAAPAEALRAFAGQVQGPVYLLGDGAQVVRGALPDLGHLTLYPADHRQGRALGVCRAALQSGETVPPAQLCPDYHRLSQAQRERAARLKAEKGEGKNG